MIYATIFRCHEFYICEKVIKRDVLFTQHNSPRNLINNVQNVKFSEI
jgi:hypothetical protein